ncbi:uncharacterized protein LOC26535437 [Drosophila yakuba]|uniref:Uncharacterized protein n=1 Tax=Drosophila yakuba TaxID=7245 RepID=A0A0R1DVG8_DROYA|nr:uncharacterized protein LOC26535437 [Drosophila yakuba]KRJ99232.1 uncharacterized protein Dyak_GE28256 [Drosophila yakuba]
MQFMAICLMSNIGYILGITIEQLNNEATFRLRELVEKYKLQAISNPEFSQWIRKLEKTSWSSRMQEKMKVHAEFKIYDERRQLLEAKIEKRIRAIEDLISNIIAKNPNKANKCLQYYQRQKTSLKMAHNFSNLTKQTNLTRNSKPCENAKVLSSEVDESTENHDEYSYY